MKAKCCETGDIFKVGDLIQGFLRSPDNPEGSWSKPVRVDKGFQARFAANPNTLRRRKVSMREYDKVKYDKVVFECPYCGTEHIAEAEGVETDFCGKTYDHASGDEIPIPIMISLEDYVWECSNCEWSSRVCFINEPTLIVEKD